MNKLCSPLFSRRYKEMLELVISPSLTVNSTSLGKLKPTAEADVRTLSDVEGRPGVSCGGPEVVPAYPTEPSKGPASSDTHPFHSATCCSNDFSPGCSEGCLWTRTSADVADNFV